MLRAFLFATLVAVAVAGCDLAADEPPTPGTYSLRVSGDVSAQGAGLATVAEPDSGLDVSSQVFTESIAIVFEADGASDRVQLWLSVFEPTQPNVPFTRLPEGTFETCTGRDPREPCYIGSARIRGRSVTILGPLTLQRRAGGAEGTLQGRFAGRDGFGPVSYAGDVDLRFHALAPVESAGEDG